MFALEKFNRKRDQIYAKVAKEDIPPGLKSHVFVMRVLGLWPTVDDSPRYKWLTIAFYMSSGMYVVSMGVNILFVDSIPDFMNFLFLSMYAGTIAIKASIIYWQRDNIRDIIRMQTEYLLAIKCSPKYHDRMARMNIRIHVWFASLYYFCTFVVVVQVIFSKPEEAVLSSTSLWPYDFAQRQSVYLIVLVAQIVCGFVIVTLLALEDSLHIALMNILRGHVWTLEEQLKGLGMDNASEEDQNALHYKNLLECCKQYEKCLSFAAKMDTILSPSFFVKFATSGLALCCSVYLLSVSNPMDDLFKFGAMSVYCLVAVAQIFPICYFGSRLTAESDGITNAIYESQWMDRDKKFKRAMRILVERSMRPMTIYAGGLFELSLGTFVRICRSAYSSFNLLHTMDSKKA